MRADKAASVLAATDLFRDIDADGLDAIVERSIARRYQKGDFVFHEGDQGDTLFVLAEGMVKVFVTSEDGDEMVLATLRPPETFGELAVIDEGPRSASAKAMEPTTLLAFTRATFLHLLQEHPALMRSLYRTLGTLLRRVLEQASDLIFLDLPGRVAKLLVTLAEEVGDLREEGTLLDLRMTQGTLAGMVGGSRPSVNQILRNFEQRGYLELQGKQILIKRPELLRRRAVI